MPLPTGSCMVTVRLLSSMMLAVLIGLFLAGCGGSPTPETVLFLPSVTPGAVVPTRAPTHTPTPVTPTATPTHTPTPTPTDTPTPTHTASPTSTVTDTPTPTHTPTPSTPVALALRAIPVRSGPALAYPAIGSLEVNEQLDILGISEDGNWFQVRLPDGSAGWLSASTALVEASGDLRSVPVALAPTNTPTFTPVPTDTPSPTPTATATETPTSTPTALPSPTPLLPGVLPDTVRTALAAAGIAPQDGVLAAQRDRQAIDLTGEDDLIRWERFAGQFGDFAIGAIIQWGPGAAEDQCGFLFREVDADNFYTVQIARTGSVWFTPWLNGAWGDTVNGDGSLVRTGREERNQFVLVARGSVFTVFLNGQRAGQFEDPALAAGQAALMAGTFDESDETRCTFTDAWVFDLSAGAPAANLPAYVAAGLAAAGLPSSVGMLAAELESKTIDLTGQDNRLQWERLSGEYSDFVAGTQITWGPGAAEDYCGFVFREVDSDNLYSIQISRDRTLSFSKKAGGEWQPDITGDGSRIRAGLSDINDLVIVVRGSGFDVYLNGAFADRFEDSALASGSVAVMFGTYDESDETSCTFTNSWIWDLTRTGAAPEDVGREQAIAYGDTVQGSITANASVVRYRFEGRAGDIIGIRMNVTSGSLDPYLVLLNAAGERVAENDDDPQESTLNAYLRRLTLPSTGAYTILATRYGEQAGTTTGDFELTLEAVEVASLADATPMAPVAITIGDTVQGSIEGAAGAVRYTFTAQAGDVVTIRMQRMSGDLDPLLVLLDASGVELARNDDLPQPQTYDALIEAFIIPADGEYTVIATRYQETVGLSEGNFTLTLERVQP